MHSVGVVRIELAVVELEIVVNDGDATHPGNVTDEARVQRLDLGWRIVEAGELPARRPSIDLALHESGGPAQIAEVARHGIETVEIGHGVDESQGDPAPNLRVRLHARRDGRPYHFAVPSLHDEEVRAEHAGRQSRESTLNSRRMSCAPGAIWPMGGRRSTSSWGPRRIR